MSKCDHCSVFLLCCVSQVPTASVFVDGAAALNRVRWSHTGKEIATGDSEGQVQVFDVGEVSSSLRRFGWFFFGTNCPFIQTRVNGMSASRY